MRKFIGHLIGDPPGQIYWANLCAHFHKGALDIALARTAFQNANGKFKPSPFFIPNESDRAYLAICNETEPNAIAVAAISNVQDVDWGEIQLVNTVINDTSWWKYYATLDKDALKDLLESSFDTDTMPAHDEHKLGKRLLQNLWDQGRKDLLEEFGDSLKPGLLKTAVNRFWASTTKASRPPDAKALVEKLGLSHFQVGDWVIEVAYDPKEIQKLIDGNRDKDFKRPSALCVNDRMAPRFRALTPNEVTMAPGRTLLWHGWTVDLALWASSPTHDMNGLPEMMCPATQWGTANLPASINLAGKIDAPTNTPSNEHYAIYLQGLFAEALADEHRLIAALA